MGPDSTFNTPKSALYVSENNLFRSCNVIICTRIRNDLSCVEWDVKPYTLTFSLIISTVVAFEINGLGWGGAGTIGYDT